MRSRSFVAWVSCTKKDWLHRSHRAEKRRQDSVSHGRPYSSKESSLKQYAESSLEQDDDSCKTMPRVKDNTKCKTDRKGKPQKNAPRPARRRKSGEARVRPSHMRPVSFRENTLQHFWRNTKNTQNRCNKGKSLSASKRSKFENQFSNSVSSIFHAEDM